jgi:hypothetical protein
LEKGIAMIVRHLLTNLEHEVRGKKHVGSFLRLEKLEHWDREELTKLAETKVFDPRSRANLESDGSAEQSLNWFVSIDGNYLVVRGGQELLPAGQDFEYLNFFVEGSLSEILKQIRVRIYEDAAQARRVFKHAGLPSGKLPKRIKLSQLREVNLEEILHRIRNVDPFGSPDDILAYVIIAGREKDEWGKDILAMCKREASERFSKHGYENSDFAFPLNQVSVEELEARHVRGMETLAKFNNKFPVVGCLENRVIGYDEWNWNVEEFLRGLSDDVLVELLLVFFRYPIEQTERSKLLFGEATQRIHRQFN